MCCRPLLKQALNRARLLPISEQLPYLRRSQSYEILGRCPFQDIECFHQARLVRITHRRLAIWLDPLRMLDPQVVVNLSPQVCVCIKLVKHNH